MTCVWCFWKLYCNATSISGDSDCIVVVFDYREAVVILLWIYNEIVVIKLWKFCSCRLLCEQDKCCVFIVTVVRASVFLLVFCILGWLKRKSADNIEGCFSIITLGETNIGWQNYCITYYYYLISKLIDEESFCCLCR